MLTSFVARTWEGLYMGAVVLVANCDEITHFDEYCQLLETAMGLEKHGHKLS
jgi:hypothetical protein